MIIIQIPSNIGTQERDKSRFYFTYHFQNSAFFYQEQCLYNSELHQKLIRKVFSQVAISRSILILCPSLLLTFILFSLCGTASLSPTILLSVFGYPTILPRKLIHHYLVHPPPQFYRYHLCPVIAKLRSLYIFYQHFF